MLRPRQAGFALLITITLVAFLVLILVSIATLTRVETQVASNSQQLNAARQNAVLALNIAIGELQKYAGPDQRTTARADLDASLSNVTNANGRWTGVYGSRVSADYADQPDTISQKITDAYSAAGSDSLASKGSQAILLNWLVSGNETADFDPINDVSAGDGHITLTSPPGIPRKPSDTADLATAPVNPTASSTSMLLVGPGTVAADADRVTAPLVPIKVNESDLAGFSSGGTTTLTIGRYAWWVGDEGAKAHINLTPDAATAQLPPVNPDLAFATSQRSAVELIDKANPTSSTATFSTDDLVGTEAYNPTGTQINKLLSLEQLTAVNTSVWDTASKLRFHDLTAASSSLLTDSYAGGLKKDLSALLAAGAASPVDTEYLFVPQGGASGGAYGLPTWGKLRSFVQTTEGTAASDALEPRLPSATDVGIAPVMTYADIQFQYFVNGTKITVAVMPRVVLWNPYTRPIGSSAKPARFELGMSHSHGYFQLQRRLSGSSDAWLTVDGPRAVRWGGQTSLSGGPYYLRFIVESEGIPPGESHLFGLDAVQVYSAPDGSPPTNTLRWVGSARYATFSTDVDYDPAYDYRIKADRTLNGSSDSVRDYLGTGSNRGGTAYLGQDPAEHSDHSPRLVWPPDGTTNNRWYQSTLYVASQGAAAVASQAYLQNSSSDGLPDGLPNAPIPNDWWGHAQYQISTSGTRYLAVSNPRAGFVDYLDNSTNVLIGHTIPGYNDQRTLGSGNMNVYVDSGRGWLSSTSFLNVPPGTTPENNILHEFRPESQPLMSIGQLQHANLSFALSWPTYLIGNSNAPIYDMSGSDANRPRLYPAAPPSGEEQRAGFGYDAAYLVNRALWDRYFVSTVPSAGTSASGVTAIPTILPNPRHVWQESASTLTDAEKRDGDTVAAHLTLKGGFNINSTSEQAWRAVLGGLNLLNQHAAGAVVDSPLDAAMPRFASPPDAVAINGTRTDWAHTGYRTLNANQIDALAKSIVAQIRNRGPFISMGDFVNRRLKDNPATVAPATGPQFNHIESLKGALQDAIDSTPVSGPASINNRHNASPFNTVSGGYYSKGDQEAMEGGPVRLAPVGSNSAYAPQYLSQADILSAIGPGLSARSDTFTVRTYGDSINPVTGEVTGRAWCEAVVQRTIEPLRRRSADPTSADYYEPAATAASQADFGRRFQIISFRWLSPNDI